LFAGYFSSEFYGRRCRLKQNVLTLFYFGLNTLGITILISWVEFPEACFGFDLSVQYVFQNAPELAPGFFTLLDLSPATLMSEGAGEVVPDRGTDHF
jgi:hypothetical protein